jgi:hypothetical protein
MLCVQDTMDVAEAMNETRLGYVADGVSDMLELAD